MQPNASPNGQALDPCTMVIFGASGDLTKRKLIPALCNLAASGFLPKQFALVGLAARPLDTAGWRESLTAEIKDYVSQPIDPAVWAWLMERSYYQQVDFTAPGAFENLKPLLDKVDQDHGTRGNRFYYLAVSPSFFGLIAQKLNAAGLTEQAPGRYARVIVEKPFGRDLDSARQLNADLRAVLSEKQIYRIDHYLGKETVQNIMVFRFGNSIFEPIWNRHFIEHVQITAAETVGVEHRGGYYETSGALRDMVPNHLFQLLTLTAMEPPVSFDADAVRSRQVDVLQAIQPPSP